MAAAVDVAMNVLMNTWLSPHLLSWNLDDLLRELGHTQCPCHLHLLTNGFGTWQNEAITHLSDSPPDSTPSSDPCSLLYAQRSRVTGSCALTGA